MWGVSLTHPVLAWFLCGEFLLHIPCWLHFYLESFSYTFRAGFIFIWRVSLPHPVLASFLSGEFLFHIPCWLHFYLESFSYTSCADFDSVEFLLHILCWLWLGGVSLTLPVLTLTWWSVSYTSCADFDSVDFLLHIPYCFHFYLGNVPYTSRAGFFFLSFFSFSYTSPGEFLLHIPCWFLYWRSFSYTSRAGFFSSFFLFSFFFWGVSLTQPILASILSGEFLLHIPCWLSFYQRAFAYTCHAGFIFIWGVSLTHPVLTLFLSGEFLLYIPCWLLFMRWVSLTHPELIFFFFIL